MSIIVEKYGGTSVGSIERIQSVSKNVAKQVRQGYKAVVVVSAMSGETNRLVALAKSMTARPSDREMDTLLSTGEQVTIALFALALQNLEIPAQSFTGFQVPIVTDSVHSRARITNIEVESILAVLNAGKVAVVAGFQGINSTNEITTLGRGGSDTTAVALAAALKAKECRIYTDVDGVYTADPRVVEGASRIPKITYEEMLEMSGSGAKVMQIRAVEFASKYEIPLRVLSSFEPDEGTIITKEEDIMEQPKISGITSVDGEAKVTVRGVPDRPGIAYSILGPISDAHINVDMIVQNIGTDETTDLTFTVNQDDLHTALDVLAPVVRELDAETVVGDKNLAKISVIGVGMRSHAGIATTMFKALAEKGINIQIISTSEIKISVTIDREYRELAVRTLHSAFRLEERGKKE
ncbi:MAG: aspartate kinase [Gammaproteobacteria bacterium]|nr:aspartate kinase [Gammaproteobacteria bacterium]MCY4218300.1 aspartate kinase [Gammaproteobacteria bacterium]MCY4274309.1 aspartate kinase [Gammaproteobacteria bacterium]